MASRSWKKHPGSAISAAVLAERLPKRRHWTSDPRRDLQSRRVVSAPSSRATQPAESAWIFHTVAGGPGAGCRNLLMNRRYRVRRRPDCVEGARQRERRPVLPVGASDRHRSPEEGETRDSPMRRGVYPVQRSAMSMRNTGQRRLRDDQSRCARYPGPWRGLKSITSGSRSRTLTLIVARVSP